MMTKQCPFKAEPCVEHQCMAWQLPADTKKSDRVLVAGGTNPIVVRRAAAQRFKWDIIGEYQPETEGFCRLIPK